MSGFFVDATELQHAVARLCRLHGLPSLAARIYALLVLSADGRTADELVAAIGARGRAVESALYTLVGAGIVTTSATGFEAVGDPWPRLVAWRRARAARELTALHAFHLDELGGGVAERIARVASPPPDLAAQAHPILIRVLRRGRCRSHARSRRVRR